MSSSTERWAKVKNEQLFSRQPTCFAKKCWRRCERHLGNLGLARQQGTGCSCWITEKWVVEIKWKPLRAIFIGLEVWSNNGRVGSDLNCMPSLEIGKKWECENIGTCSSRTARSNCNTQERQTPVLETQPALPEHRNQDSLRWFCCLQPWRTLRQCPDPKAQLLWFRLGTDRDTQAPLSSPTAKAVFLISLLVPVSAWLVSFFSASQPLSLSPRQNHASQNSQIPGQPTLYETYVYCILKIP